MGVIRRNGKWALRFRDPLDDKWVTVTIEAKSQREAEGLLARVVATREEQIRAQVAGILESVDARKRPEGPLIDSLVGPWLERRAKRGVRNVPTERGQWKLHLLPPLSGKTIHEITVGDVRAVVDGLVVKGLAPRTVRCIYGTLRTFFQDQIIDQVIKENPCILRRAQLPKKRDKDPTWRVSALFSRAEVHLLCFNPIIPPHRRVLYTILLLTGARLGEAAGIRWRDIDWSARPLPRLIIARSYHRLTKTEVPRLVPVHPVLARVLGEWRSAGYLQVHGRQPNQEDLVVPGAEGHLSRNIAWKALQKDLAALGRPPRRVHDTRRTMITLARAAGARVDVLEPITHGAKGDIMNMYTTLPWEVLCEAILRLDVEYLSAEQATALADQEKAGGL